MQSNYMLTRKYLTEIFTPLISSLHTALNDKFTVGFSPLNSLTRNYKEMHDFAVESLDFRRVTGGNRLIFHQDIADDKNWVVPFDNTAYKQLISALRNSTCAEMHKLLSNLLESASKKKILPLLSLREIQSVYSDTECLRIAGHPQQQLSAAKQVVYSLCQNKNERRDARLYTQCRKRSFQSEPATQTQFRSQKLFQYNTVHRAQLYRQHP